MGRCKTCKHWGRNRKDNWAPGEWADCALAAKSDGAYEHPESLAHADDCEDYLASLETHATFGCVQYAEKGAG